MMPYFWYTEIMEHEDLLFVLYVIVLLYIELNVTFAGFVFYLSGGLIRSLPRFLRLQC